MKPEKKAYQHTLTFAFTRLLWKPREGDPVILADAGGRHKLKIKSVFADDIYLENDAGPFTSKRLFYRSPPSAVREVWEKLRKLCAYSQEVSPGRWIAGVKVNSIMTILRGRTVRVAAQLLELRAIDMQINDGVNRIANDVKKLGSLRLVYSSKESHPE